MYPSYEELMTKKLDMVSDKRDKRQGSIIFDALAPNAAETATFYMDLSMLENRTYADTACGEDLTKRCVERGVFRKKATKSILLGKFVNAQGEGIEIPENSRFYLEELNYAIVSAGEQAGEYLLQCETAGSIGNTYVGELIPVEYIQGLAHATLVELLVDGEDQEGDEELRKRYFDSFQTDAFGGNIADYQQKLSALQGVGGVKVYPVWNGGGTVKLVVLDQSFQKPSETELAVLQNKIDPQQNGMGEGLAPIGHKVTVEGATEVDCSIGMKLVLMETADLEQITQEIQQRFQEYLLALRKTWESAECLVVRVSYLESKALDVTGVLDVQNTQINGNPQNFILQDCEIPIFKELEVCE